MSTVGLFGFHAIILFIGEEEQPTAVNKMEKFDFYTVSYILTPTTATSPAFSCAESAGTMISCGSERGGRERSGGFCCGCLSI